jgi:hypothetical protein
VTAIMRLIPAACALVLGIAMGGPAAVAAPQVLGLTASNAPIPFSCVGDSCTAVAGSFCLQRERMMPSWGMPYGASHPERLTLALIAHDGSIARVAGGPWIKFSAYNGYTMVRMSVPRALLAAHGATAAAAEIGPGIALVPLPQVGDDDPQSADEIALAIGPMRIAAAHYLDQPSVGTDAARLVAALVNALPEQHTVDDDNSGLWQSTITDGLAGAVDPAAVSSARHAYEICRDLTDLRRCLVSQHHDLMERGNVELWDETSGY